MRPLPSLAEPHFSAISALRLALATFPTPNIGLSRRMVPRRLLTTENGERLPSVYHHLVCHFGKPATRLLERISSLSHVPRRTMIQTCLLATVPDWCPASCRRRTCTCARHEWQLIVGLEPLHRTSTTAIREVTPFHLLIYNH